MGYQPMHHYCQLEHNTQKRGEIPVPRSQFEPVTEGCVATKMCLMCTNIRVCVCVCIYIYIYMNLEIRNTRKENKYF